MEQEQWQKSSDIGNFDKGQTAGVVGCSLYAYIYSICLEQLTTEQV